MFLGSSDPAGSLLMTHPFISISFFLFTVWVHFVWPRSPDQSAVDPLKPAARLAAHSSAAAVKLLLKLV